MEGRKQNERGQLSKIQVRVGVVVVDEVVVVVEAEEEEGVRGAAVVEEREEKRKSLRLSLRRRRRQPSLVISVEVSPVSSFISFVISFPFSAPLFSVARTRSSRRSTQIRSSYSHIPFPPFHSYNSSHSFPKIRAGRTPRVAITRKT